MIMIVTFACCLACSVALIKVYFVDQARYKSTEKKHWLK